MRRDAIARRISLEAGHQDCDMGAKPPGQEPRIAKKSWRELETTASIPAQTEQNDRGSDAESTHQHLGLSNATAIEITPSRRLTKPQTSAIIMAATKDTRAASKDYEGGIFCIKPSVNNCTGFLDYD